MPTFSFTAPDGKTYDIEGPADATQEQAYGLLQQHMAANPPSTGEKVWNTAKRVTGLTARTLATIPTGLANVIADPIVGSINMGRNAMARVQGEPEPTELKMPSQAWQDVLTDIGLPQAETGIEKAAVMLGSLAGGRLDPLAKGLTARFMKANPNNVVPPGARRLTDPDGLPIYQPPRLSDRQLNTRAAMGAGYTMPPSSTAGGAGPIAKMGEALGGSSQVADIARSKNQILTDTLLKRAAGLPKDAHLNRDTLEGAISSTFKSTYDPIKQLPQISNGSIYRNKLNDVLAQYGDAAPGAKNQGVYALVNAYKRQAFTGEQAVNFIKALRTNADKAFRSTDAGSNELGMANKAIANAIEDSIQLNLSRNPRYATIGEDLVGKYQAGRKLMAKQHAVRESILEGTGSGNALHLASALQRGEPLTDELLTIAKTANIAPNVMKMPTTAPKLFNTWETGTGAYGLGRMAGGDMTGAYFAALPVARLGARQMLTTKPAQAMMKPKLDPNILSRLGSKQGVVQALPALMQQYGLFMQQDEPK